MPPCQDLCSVMLRITGEVCKLNLNDTRPQTVIEQVYPMLVQQLTDLQTASEKVTRTQFDSPSGSTDHMQLIQGLSTLVKALLPPMETLLTTHISDVSPTCSDLWSVNAGVFGSLWGLHLNTCTAARNWPRTWPAAQPADYNLARGALLALSHFLLRATRSNSQVWQGIVGRADPGAGRREVGLILYWPCPTLPASASGLKLGWSKS